MAKRTKPNSILVRLKVAPESIPYLIDEPELHLHPKPVRINTAKCLNIKTTNKLSGAKGIARETAISRNASSGRFTTPIPAVGRVVNNSTNFIDVEVSNRLATSTHVGEEITIELRKNVGVIAHNRVKGNVTQISLSPGTDDTGPDSR